MKNTLTFLASTFFALIILLTATCQAQTEKTSYPAMAPLDQYLIPDVNSEIALARRSALHFRLSRSDGAGAAGIRHCCKRNEWFSLHSGTILGRRHRRTGVLESESARPHLL